MNNNGRFDAFFIIFKNHATFINKFFTSGGWFWLNFHFICEFGFWLLCVSYINFKNIFSIFFLLNWLLICRILKIKKNKFKKIKKYAYCYCYYVNFVIFMLLSGGFWFLNLNNQFYLFKIMNRVNVKMSLNPASIV